jgi:hypothetical protein
MIREHVRHLHHAVDERSIPMRVLITVVAVAALPLLGTGVRRLGAALDLGALVVPLLALAHVPVVIALVCVWSIGCEVCR